MGTCAFVHLGWLAAVCPANSLLLRRRLVVLQMSIVSHMLFGILSRVGGFLGLISETRTDWLFWSLLRQGKRCSVIDAMTCRNAGFTALDTERMLD